MEKPHRETRLLILHAHICCRKPHGFDSLVERHPIHTVARHRELSCCDCFDSTKTIPTLVNEELKVSKRVPDQSG